MAQLEVDPVGVAAAGTQVSAAGQHPRAGGGPIRPAAADPVSVAAAETLSARRAAIAAYSAAAGQITQIRAGMLTASGAAYAEQETANQGGLTLGGAAPALVVGAAPAPAALPAAMVPPAIPPPVVGPPPGDGRTIAALIHNGSTESLYAAEQQLRQQATELSAIADQLRGSAGRLDQDWRSQAGEAAAGRLRVLGTWHDTHAAQASDAAAACATAAGNYGRAKAAIPSPEKFEEVEQRLTNATAAAAANPRYAALYAPVITQLQNQLANLHEQALTGYTHYSAATEASNLTGNPLEPPPRTGAGVHALDNPTPQPAGLLGQFPAPDKHLIYCYPHSGPGQWLCEGFDDVTGRDYTFYSPIDVSGVAD